MDECGKEPDAWIRSTVRRETQELQRYAECVAIGAMEFDKLVAFAKEHAD